MAASSSRSVASSLESAAASSSSRGSTAWYGGPWSAAGLQPWRWVGTMGLRLRVALRRAASPRDWPCRGAQLLDRVLRRLRMRVEMEHRDRIWWAEGPGVGTLGAAAAGQQKRCGSGGRKRTREARGSGEEEVREIKKRKEKEKNNDRLICGSRKVGAKK